MSRALQSPPAESRDAPRYGPVAIALHWLLALRPVGPPAPRGAPPEVQRSLGP